MMDIKKNKKKKKVVKPSQSSTNATVAKSIASTSVQLAISRGLSVDTSGCIQ